MAADPRIPAFGPAPFLANPNAPKAPRDYWWRNFFLLVFTTLVLLPLVACMTVGFMRAIQAPQGSMKAPITTCTTSR